MRRTHDSQLWQFVLNHSDEPVEVRLDRPGLDILSGSWLGGTVRLAPQGVAIVRSFLPARDEAVTGAVPASR